MAEIVVISGLSGAGRSGAANVLEDLGWFVIDNLPTALVSTFVELAAKPGSEIAKLALVGGRDHVNVLSKVAELRADGHNVRVLFLDATTAELVKRYDATRRRHPLVAQADGLVESIELERQQLDKVRGSADLIIDTTELNVHQLKDRILQAFDAGTESRLQVAVESFGFKHGLPLDADMVLDVRFLPNPHWDEGLRPLTGHDPAVSDYVLETSSGSDFVDRIHDLLSSLLPQYESEGRSYLTVAIGCTGGRHRSVAVAEELAGRLRSDGVAVRAGHRDLAR
jgi:UPF0042 nucleotide-binding protein